MEIKDLGLTPKNEKKIQSIINKIHTYKRLDSIMDYVDQLDLCSILPDEIDEDTENNIDEFLRDYVGNL